MSTIAQFRVRAGWGRGNFLPYAFAGFAVGRANVSSSATISYTAVDFPILRPPLVPLYTAADPLTFGPQFQGNSTWLYGFTRRRRLGCRARATNMFVRAEFEYIQFAQVDIPILISTARVGAGLKF